MLLGQGGRALRLALLDTGAALSAVDGAAHSDFKMNGPYPGEPDGFYGDLEIEIGGATGSFFGDDQRPAGSVRWRIAGSHRATSPLDAQPRCLGRTNQYVARTLPAESDLPNVVGLTFASRYAT